MNESTKATESIKAAKREYNKRWRAKNIEQVRAYHREWAKNNKDKIDIYQDTYWSKKALEMGLCDE